MKMPLSVLHPASPSTSLAVRCALDDQLDLRLFRALADPTRLRIFSCLVKCGRPCSVSELAVCCDIDFSVVNKHLKLLAEAGVLMAEKRGRTVWYRARCADLCDRLDALTRAIREWCPNLPAESSPTGRSACCTPLDREHP